MVSFFAEVKIFSFWIKTMDYSQAFWPKLMYFFVILLLLPGRWYESDVAFYVVFGIHVHQAVMFVIVVLQRTTAVPGLRSPSIPTSSR